MTNMKTQFGERIQIIRKNAGCSQKKFGLELNIPQTTLSAYETDRMQPTVSTLINIATKYNVSMDWLCGLEPKEPQLNVIRLKGNGFTAEIPIDISPELLAVFLDKIVKENDVKSNSIVDT